MKKYLLLIATTIAITTPLLIQTTNAGGVIPGTISIDFDTSPARACTVDNVGGEPSSGLDQAGAWPVYGCQQDSTAGCRIYNTGSSSVCGACSVWNTSTTYPVTGCTYDATQYSGPGCTGTVTATATGTAGLATCTWGKGLSGGCDTPNKIKYTNIVDTTTATTVNTTCKTYPSCKDSSFGCETYYTAPYISSYITKQRFQNNLNQTLNFTEKSKTLGNQFANSCEVDAYGTDSTSTGTFTVGYTAPTPTSYGTNGFCERGGPITTYASGSDGGCRFINTDYSIPVAPTGFSQTSGFITHTSPTGTLSGCTVEGLKSTADNTGPTIVVGGSAKGVFDTDPDGVNPDNIDQDHWCNMTKYRDAGYGATLADTLPGCEFYRQKISPTPGTGDKNPDLLKGLEITVDDVSGVSEITVEIGSCSTTYSLSTAIADIVKNTNTASGVKDSYRNITLKYNALSTNGGGLPALLTKFSTSRLDSCLVDGKNYIRVTAKDNSRSDSDGKTFNSPTNTSYWTSGNNSASNAATVGTTFIKVDTAVPQIKLTGEANKPASSTASATQFIAPPTFLNVWKNFTIKGGIYSGDPFGSNSNPPPSCGTLTKVNLTCTMIKPSDTVWTAPAGVTSTGDFEGIKCDGVGPIPNVDSCAYGCLGGKTFDKATGKCELNPLKICVVGGTIPCVIGG